MNVASHLDLPASLPPAKAAIPPSTDGSSPHSFLTSLLAAQKSPTKISPVADDSTGTRRLIKTTPASEASGPPSLPAQQLSPNQPQPWLFPQAPEAAVSAAAIQDQPQSPDTKQVQPELPPLDAAAALGRANAQGKDSPATLFPTNNPVAGKTQSAGTQILAARVTEPVAVTNSGKPRAKVFAAPSAPPQPTQTPAVQWAGQAVLSSAPQALVTLPAGSTSSPAQSISAVAQPSTAYAPPAPSPLASLPEALAPSLHGPETSKLDQTPAPFALPSAEPPTQPVESSESHPAFKPEQGNASPRISAQPTIQPRSEPELPPLIQLDPVQGLPPADPTISKIALSPAKATITSAIAPTASAPSSGQPVHVAASQPANPLDATGSSQQSATQPGDQSPAAPAPHPQDAVPSPAGAPSQPVIGAAQAAAILSPAPSTPATPGSAHPVSPQNISAPAPAAPQPAPEINSARLIQSVGQTDMRVGLHSSEFGNISIHTSATRDLVSAQISLDHDELARTLVTHLPEMQARLANNPALEIRIDMNGQPAGQGQGTANGSGQDAQSGQHTKSLGAPPLSNGPAVAPRPLVAAASLGSHNNASRLDITV